jgi:phosphoglucomutase
LRGTFTDAHVAAITQAICDYRTLRDVSGPLFLGKDTHALSDLAFTTAIEVLAGNNVMVLVDADGGWTPTPVLSHAILSHNSHRLSRLADGIILTPSHNPPDDGGVKYNPTTGGPSDAVVTQWIEQRANELLVNKGSGVIRMPYSRARRSGNIHAHDFISAYVRDLPAVVDLDVIANAGLKVGVDPLGGASLALWHAIADRFGLDLAIVNEVIDPTFSFMTLDWDGTIRMDCSSALAMATLISLKDRFDVAFANDPDADRHGIVTRSAGLVPPNQYLAAALAYLCDYRPTWPADAAVGKTAVSSSIIDRVAEQRGRPVVEVPVGFKWFVPGLLDGSLVFAGEESAGASFVRRNGTAWVTEKDGIILNLLAVEMLARTGRDPSDLYDAITRQVGRSWYARIDAPANDREKAALSQLSPDDVHTSELAGDPIVARLTAATGNGAKLGGLKVVTTQGWFAARPSGTEAVYKLYAESFRGADHLQRIQEEAQVIVTRALSGAR